MARYLLLPAADTKASLEATRGKHALPPKKVVPYPDGERYAENFRQWLRRYKATQAWRTRAEFLALASIYLEGRGRGLEFCLPGARRVALAVMSRDQLPDAEKYWLLRLAACVSIAHGDRQGRFLHMRSFPYVEQKFLEYSSFVWPLLQRMGKPASALISDFLVHSWFDYHKDFWDLAPSRYEEHVNVCAHTNDKKQGFIRDLIHVLSGRHHLYMQSGVIGEEEFLVTAPRVTVGLAKELGVSLEHLEIERLFGDLIKGETKAEDMPESAQVWSGIENLGFSKAVNNLLSNKNLLNLASPTHCLRPLLPCAEVDLRFDLLDRVLNDGLLDRMREALLGLRLSLSKMPVSDSYFFENFHSIMFDSSQWYWQDNATLRQKDRATKLRGALSALFMMMDTPFVHQRMAAHLKEVVLPEVDTRLKGLVSENVEDIKLARELFHHMGSVEGTTDLEAQDVTLDALSSAGASMSPPKVLQLLVRCLKANIKQRVATAISDELDSSWKVVSTVSVNFDD